MAKLSPPKSPKVKLVLLGDTAVGKTSIVERYANDNFADDLNTTIGGMYMERSPTFGFPCWLR